MDGVVVEQKKAEHVRGDCVDAAVLERQLGFVNICFILTPVFGPCFLINIKHRKNCECCPGHYLSTSVY